MPFVVDASLLLYAGSSCLQDKDEIKTQLNKNFEDICNWFIDNHLCIHFGENETKLIFAPKRKMKCQMFLVLKVISKVNSVLKFLYQTKKSASWHQHCANYFSVLKFHPSLILLAQLGIQT